jgi:hypothetical protein
MNRLDSATNRPDPAPHSGNPRPRTAPDSGRVTHGPQTGAGRGAQGQPRGTRPTEHVPGCHKAKRLRTCVRKPIEPRPRCCKPNHACPRVPQGQATVWRGAARTLDALLGATRPNLCVPGCHNTKRTSVEVSQSQTSLCQDATRPECSVPGSLATRWWQRARPQAPHRAPAVPSSRRSNPPISPFAGFHPLAFAPSTCESGHV